MAQSLAFAAFIKQILEDSVETDNRLEEWIKDMELPHQMRIDLIAIQTRVRIMKMTITHLNETQMDVDDRLARLITKYTEAAQV